MKYTVIVIGMDTLEPVTRHVEALTVQEAEREAVRGTWYENDTAWITGGVFPGYQYNLAKDYLDPVDWFNKHKVKAQS